MGCCDRGWEGEGWEGYASACGPVPRLVGVTLMGMLDFEPFTRY